MSLKYFFKHKYLYLMIVPLLLWYVVFCYLPMYGIVLAFQDYHFSKGILSPLNGIQNFVELFKDPFFPRSMANTVVISLLRIVFTIPAAIVFAILLNEVQRVRYKKFIQTVTYLPHFVSWVAMAGILSSMLVRDKGMVNILLMSLGLGQEDFLANSQYFRTIVILTDVWKETGWNSIVFLSAISGIDAVLYESAFVDGAARFKRILNITLPCISNTIFIMLILAVGNIMNAGFDQIYNLYNPMVYDTGDIIDTYLFRSLGSSPEFGVLAAAGLIKSVACFILLIAANKLSNLMGQEGIYSTGGVR